ncbi:hypothetical protein XA68_10629 [Ophiocordyceps unilateralis]|uniref:Transmembrane protein n=1 Tax=Ophiocordyceps unilateralis TaxID=268505 RepID=A0A2A9PGZ4_OPHUN|nr:hypothetical protein XA68_10629 [Ophiocordyceps unilateralis]
MSVAQFGIVVSVTAIDVHGVMVLVFWVREAVVGVRLVTRISEVMEQGGVVESGWDELTRHGMQPRPIDKANNFSS